ncbi:hypothetical protein CHS0354_038249 [Potamilus streckersoni]|uniref:Uncharacterized protein n=1 Tax=Potamilus streckersoni TaxID=2493646 RepID=A0AAE0W4X8_9BIVA|nr:hypothetical protein CHS0354_038249 [Potamilus streckersoni]
MNVAFSVIPEYEMNVTLLVIPVDEMNVAFSVITVDEMNVAFSVITVDEMNVAILVVLKYDMSVAFSDSRDNGKLAKLPISVCGKAFQSRGSVVLVSRFLSRAAVYSISCAENNNDTIFYLFLSRNAVEIVFITKNPLSSFLLLRFLLLCNNFFFQMNGENDLNGDYTC